MKIYAADIIGVRGKLFRLDVGAQVKHQGIGLLGSVRKILSQGIIDRVRHAVAAFDDSIELGTGMRITVDINPPESKLSSSGSDLPIAIVLLFAHFLHHVEAIKKRIEDAEAKHAKLAGQNTAKAEQAREELLQLLKELKPTLKKAQILEKKLDDVSGRFLLIGKLNLNGTLEAPERGVFSMLDGAEKGMHIIVPPECEIEAGLIAKSKGGTIKASVAKTLTEAWQIVIGAKAGTPCRFSRSAIKEKLLTNSDLDLRAIKGCWLGKKALEVALAGGHPLLLQGPGGQGKSMLAEAATSLLPGLEQQELREVNRVYSAKGELNGNELVLKPPFRMAGQSVTKAALFGGGQDARPGLISLAHRGVLFLDEINLINHTLIEDLRQPMNDGYVPIQRAKVNEQLPSKFLLLAAMNPCKCSWYGHYECRECDKVFLSPNGTCPSCKKRSSTSKCSCRKPDIERYSKHLSGPIKDRIDLITTVSQFDTFKGDEKTYSTKYVRTRIKRARERQRKRYKDLAECRKEQRIITCNGDIANLTEFEEHVKIPEPTKQHFEKRKREEKIESMRKNTRLWLVAQTIADLDERDRITKKDVDWAFSIAGFGAEAIR